MFETGNTFKSDSFGFGHARKVWREIHDIYPAGGKFATTAGFTGKIPAGTPVKFDMAAKTITPITNTAITSASDVSALGINGFLQEDVVLAEDAQYTGTVVYRGELYSFMLGDGVPAKLAGVVPGVVFVQ